MFPTVNSTLPVRPLIAGLLLASLLGWASFSSAQISEINPAPAFSGERLVSLPTDGWITNGGNVYNQRYSPLDEINRDTVANLKGVWRARLGGSGVAAKYSGEAQPMVYDGVVYIVTGADDVFAISVDSGQTLWSYEANLDEAIDTICCGWTNRGVAIGEGKIFFGQLDGKLVGLDQRTGAVAWSTQAERWEEGYSITSAPLYYDGLVITGFAGAEFGVRGRVKAYDADDGSLAWTFYTVPGPGEIGHDTWPQDNDVYLYGGGNGLADTGRRSDARPRLLLDRQSRTRLQRQHPARRQPVLDLDRRRGWAYRRVPLALPAGSP